MGALQSAACFLLIVDRLEGAPSRARPGAQAHQGKILLRMTTLHVTLGQYQGLGFGVEGMLQMLKLAGAGDCCGRAV